MQAFLLFELVREYLCEIQYFNFVFTNAIEQYRIVLESGKWKHQMFLHPQRNYLQTLTHVHSMITTTMPRCYKT